MRLPNGLAWLFVGVAVSCATATARAGDWEPLVKGNDAAQFELVGIGPDTVSIHDGEVVVSGKPNGYFATKKPYANYVLRFEWKYDRPEGLKSDAGFQGNSGLLIHIGGPHKIWPKCIEAQLMNADAGNTFAINGAKFHGTKDSAAQKKAVKPVGEWNLQEVTCKGDSIVCTINGVEIARGEGASPDRGPIGWQSEGAVIRFRKIEIKAID
jgi:hypothetical protein